MPREEFELAIPAKQRQQTHVLDRAANGTGYTARYLCYVLLSFIATGYGLDGPGIESRWGARFFAQVQTGPGAHPASCTMGTGSFLGLKRPGRGADHPTPSSAEVKKE
jgi:hypothetical protein